MVHLLLLSWAVSRKLGKKWSKCDNLALILVVGSTDKTLRTLNLPLLSLSVCLSNNSVQQVEILLFGIPAFHIEMSWLSSQYISDFSFLLINSGGSR